MEWLQEELFNKLIKKYGIERRIFTTGKYKSILDSFQKQKLSDVKKLKSIQMEIFKNFKDVVLKVEVKKLINKVKISSLEVFGLEKKRLNWVW